MRCWEVLETLVADLPKGALPYVHKTCGARLFIAHTGESVTTMNPKTCTCGVDVTWRDTLPYWVAWWMANHWRIGSHGAGALDDYGVGEMTDSIVLTGLARGYLVTHMMTESWANYLERVKEHDVMAEQNHRRRRGGAA